jgi:hypothetical protein
MKKIIITLIILPILWITSVFCSPLGYGYQSSDINFTEAEFPQKGRTLKIVELNFEGYKTETDQPELILYRTTKRNPLLISEWYDYLTNKRWKYPYRDKIEKKANHH